MPEGGPGNAPFHKSSFLIYLLFVPAFLILMLMLLMAMQYKQLRILVAKDPVVMDTVVASAEAQDSVQVLVKTFFAEPGPDTLALSRADLNHLMRSSTVIRDLGWSYHLTLEDTLLVARTSMPASSMTGPAGKLIRLFRLKGWLNSEVRLRGKFITGNRFVLDPVSAVMNGESAPPTALTKQGELDPRDWVTDKDAYDKAVARLEAASIRDGRLLLLRKP
jgi:hypothetical protein